MATIDELEARIARLDEAEAAALVTLAECMRELAVELPDGSKLALQLATARRSLLQASEYRRRRGRWGALSVDTLVNDVLKDCLDRFGDDEDDD
jgi:hypothetical protein